MEWLSSWYVRHKETISTVVGVLGFTGVTFNDALTKTFGTPKETVYAVSLFMICSCVIVVSVSY